MSVSKAMELREPFASLWAQRNPFDEVEALSGTVYRELEARRTLRTEIAGRGYFVKIHRGVGWWEIIKNLLSGRLPVLGADNERRAIARLQSAGVPTMRLVAFGQRGINPAQRHSFIITEELAPTLSLEDVTACWQQQPPSPIFKRALLRRVAEISREMHAAGVNHRDFYLCHFLLHQPVAEPNLPQLSLIDLHRAQTRVRVPRRWRDKDLAGLYFSALDADLKQRDLLRFLRVYFDRPLRDVLRNEGPLLKQLAKRAQVLRSRYQRKYANPRHVD